MKWRRRCGTINGWSGEDLKVCSLFSTACTFTSTSWRRVRRGHWVITASKTSERHASPSRYGSLSPLAGHMDQTCLGSVPEFIPQLSLISFCHHWIACYARLFQYKHLLHYCHPVLAPAWNEGTINHPFEPEGHTRHLRSRLKVEQFFAWAAWNCGALMSTLDAMKRDKPSCRIYLLTLYVILSQSVWTQPECFCSSYYILPCFPFYSPFISLYLF